MPRSAWQAAGLGGLTIAGLWVLGVLAEIVVFALSPRFTLAPALLVVIGALSAVARWLITAQEPSVAVLAVVQLAHGLTYGLTQVGTMGLLVRHVPIHMMARGQGYLAACGGMVIDGGIDPVGHGLRGLRRGRLLRDGGDGARCRAHHVARAGIIWRISPTAPLPADRPGCRRSAGRRRDRAASSSGPSRSTKRACGASSIAGAIASEVATMQPIMISKPSACAASAIASASVSPPVLSSLMLTAS